MARITMEGLTKRMRTPRVQEAILTALRKLKDNPRALELYLEQLSGEQMKEMASLMRLGSTSKALKRSVDLAAQELEAKYGPEGIKWAGLRMYETLGKERIAGQERVAEIGRQARKEIGLIDIDTAKSKAASGERIAGMERAVAYPQAILDIGKGFLDWREKRAVSEELRKQGRLFEESPYLIKKPLSVKKPLLAGSLYGSGLYD